MRFSINLSKAAKIILIGLWVIAVFWLAPQSLSKTTAQDQPQEKQGARAGRKPGEYVGSETCKGCHGEMFESMSKTPHAKILSVVNVMSKAEGCESCHGPGKAHAESADITKIIRFKGEPAKELSETCLQCHAGKEEHNNYRRGEHWRNDVGCVDCHSLHSGHGTAPKMLAKSEPQLCFTCHAEMKGEFSRPFHHKVVEGAIKCSDCHNPHGGFERKQLRAATGADAACLKCHAEKQGPFVFEHAPVKVEGCAICHTPHGSNNPKMLKRDKVSQLCLECHSAIGAAGAPNTPSFHNLSTARFQSCTTCHAKIHGSNTHSFFFR